MPISIGDYKYLHVTCPILNNYTRTSILIILSCMSKHLIDICHTRPLVTNYNMKMSSDIEHALAIKSIDKLVMLSTSNLQIKNILLVPNITWQ